MRVIVGAFAAASLCACSAVPDPRAASADAGDDSERAPDASGVAPSPDSGRDALEPAPTAQTSLGPVVGSSDGTVRAFTGIPYAVPPVGDRRFRAPAAPAPWVDPLDATGYGPRCVQPNISFTTIFGEEDCLYLNVWAPEGANDLPVMVWFHGGSFVQGAGSEPTYRGHDLARHGVVVVTANYRLGPLGFLAHSELAAEVSDGSLGNYGLQDQRAALRWVRDNAAAFGGSASNVTLFGESAGAISTCLHLGTEIAGELFHKAIMQSGPCLGLLPLPDRDAALAQGAAHADALGCQTANCLRTADATELTQVSGFRPGVVFGDGAAWTPTRDGVIVPVDPAGALATSSARVPVIMGANANEGALILAGVQNDVVVVDYTAALDQMFGVRADEVAARYVLSNYPSDAEAIAAVVGDLFVCGTRAVAAAYRGTTYLYHFEQAFRTPLGDLGAMHGAELPFVFGTELGLVKLSEEEELLSEIVQQLWTSFARGDSPSGPGLPAWDPWDGLSEKHMRLLSPTPVSGDHLREDVCDFWDSLIHN